MTGGVSKHHYGRVVAFIKLIFEMGIVSSFWASQEGGYPLGDIESEELENVSLFNLFLISISQLPEGPLSPALTVPILEVLRSSTGADGATGV